MFRSSLERRLLRVTDRLAAARQELMIINEQLMVLSGSAEDARLRSLISETPAASIDADEAIRHADAMRRSHAAVASSVAELEQAHAALLEQLSSRT